ncbi:NUDIX hydrolase [Kaustia mangrovi]|uniref:NUDIX hydrolase n=1 Tax=Kaustia mangrovi TaxID=2593653 RepID=A0A7S8HB42_9HYPH|nr:NUDIX hydrolase [Kaustia mangrovi]QPC42210.1 NUDIX hydrolase [Kaustia mangrovi]
MAIETPLLATDCVVFDGAGRLLLIERLNEPHAGRFALPGGFVEIGESVEAACRRELAEETGIAAEGLTLVGVYSDPARDPRGHVVSIAFLTRVGHPEPAAGSDARAAQFRADWRDLPLAFDHGRIVADAMKLMMA